MNLVTKGALGLSALGLAFAAGAIVERRAHPVATKESVKQETAQAARVEVKQDVKALVEVKPKVVTVVKRVPVVLPGPGCPVGVEETTTTESTADSRIVQEASRQAAETSWKAVRFERVVETKRSDWSLGAFALRPAGGILDSGQGWGAGVRGSWRFAGPFSVSLYGVRAGGWYVGVGGEMSW